MTSENVAKSDDYWNGAIDAFHSEGYSSTQILEMIVNMGCDRDAAQGFCEVYDEEL